MSRHLKAISLSILLSLFALSSLLARPKLALVLSGGGAKGIAEIPVLQELDRRGIVPDMVLGTSMGALIGAFYASGYSGDEIARIVEENDIMGYFLHIYGTEETNEIKSPESLIDENFLSVKFGDDGIGGNNGLIDDQYIAGFLRKYLAKVMNVDDFDDLSIPFRCVGTDITNGRKVVFSSGSIFQAIRSSMSLPIIFSPVEIEKDVYVMDGGMEDNLPILLARELGADYVLAVDVSDAKGLYSDSQNDVSTLSGTFNEFTDYLTRPNAAAQYDYADWILVPDVSRFSTVGFGDTENILEEGRAVVEENMDFFDEIESLLGGVNNIEYLSYKDRKATTIGRIVSGNLDEYDSKFSQFIGRSMDPYTMGEFEDALAEIKRHERLKSIGYRIEGDTIYLEASLPSSLPGRVTIGGGGMVGVKNDGFGSYLAFNPSVSIGMKISLSPQAVLAAGVNVADSVSLEVGYSYPFLKYAEFFVCGKTSYGELSNISISTRRGYTARNDFSASLYTGLAYMKGDYFRTECSLGFAYTHLASIRNPIDGTAVLTALDDWYPYMSASVVYDTLNEKLSKDNGIDFSAILSLGMDPSRPSFSYSFVSLLDMVLSPDDNFKFILSAEASAVRRNKDLAVSYRSTKCGLISPDYLYAMAGMRFMLPSSFFIDAGFFIEGFTMGDNDRNIWTYVPSLVPFASMDEMDLGAMLSASLNLDIGRITAELYVSSNPRVSFMIGIR